MKKLLFIAAVLISTCITAQQKLQHISTAANTSANSTYIDAAGLNGNPGAVIIVEYDAATAKANPHAVGVWYNGKQWAVFNQDMAAMPTGITFGISWKNPDANAFYQKASANNLVKGEMIIDNPLLNNNPSASFYASQVWNPGGGNGVYNNATITVMYDKSISKWMVRNISGTAIPDGASFNISVTGGNSKDVSAVSYNKTEIKDPALVNTEPKEGKNIPSKEDNPINKVDITNVNKKDISVVPDNKPGIKYQPELKIESKENNPPVGQVDITKVNPDALLTATVDLNLGFESGLLRWRATGTAFTNQPVQGNTILSERVLTKMQYSNDGLGGDYWKGLAYPIGIKGDQWIGTYENGNGDAATGTLTSSSFKSISRYLHFLLGGGKDINRLYVELQVKLEDYQAAWGTTRGGFFGNTDDGFTRVNRISSLLNSEELFRYYFDLDAELNHQYLNKTIRICIVDDKTTAWGHINVDDIGQTNSLTDFISLRREGFGLYADKDKPVWGYFDSHAHPGADEAFGKSYYVGGSSTPLSTTWSNDVCTHSHTWGATLDGFTNIFDPHKFFDGGWPDMLGFPKFNGKMHQKYQVDLIKRAWQGGLKIFCALGVNNMYIATRELGHHPNTLEIDDESVLLRQTGVMKAMARANSDWMEIALTPQDARRIILEGKLCVILGVENDVFGNFKSPDCNWGDRGEDRPLVSITESNANDLLESKLNQYYALGLRQILPLHYLSKPFGGTAVFNGNTFLPQITFYDHVRVKTGVPDRVGFSLYEDFPTGAGFVGNGITYPAYAARAWKQDEGTEISMVNADGLTPIGNILFSKLMDKGFIIDQEHASYQSKRDMFRISAAHQNYPVIASHCTPEGLSFIWTGAPVRFSGSNENKISNFYTSTIRFVSHEMELNDESYNGIRETQGTIGVFTLLNHKKKYNGRWGNIGNDCPGSTKTIAQMYCYSLDKMNGHGVGLASDLPMVDAVCPRFGPYSAWALTVEEDASLKVALRNNNRFAQQNGVRYDVPSRSYYHGLFEGGEIDGFETDVWKALAAWEAGVNAVADESQVSLSGEPLHAGRIRNMVKGLNHGSQDQLMRPCITCGEAPWEQAAMFCLKNSIDPQSLTIYDVGGIREISNMYNRILPTWNLWKQKNGNNEPLRRCITGNRYWDFNLDGLAHYGLMPDLLQDLKNVGFSAVQFKPLFSSAEDYIKMWEKADLLKTH